MLTLKRVYEPAAPGDGLRVLVERLIAQEDDRVLVPGIKNLLRKDTVDRIAQIDAGNLRTQRG